MSTSLHAGSGETSPTPTEARIAEIEATRENRTFYGSVREDVAWLISELRAAQQALSFVQTFAPPNAFGAHTMAALLDTAQEYVARLRAASDREAALRAELMRANDRANLWSMFASSAAIVLEPLGEAYEFDDPDSLSGAITRLIQRVSALSSDEQTNE